MFIQKIKDTYGTDGEVLVEIPEYDQFITDTYQAAIDAFGTLCVTGLSR